MQRYYFDYAASTPVDSDAIKAMRPYFSDRFGNPGALHWFGQEASAAVFKARSSIAALLGCHYKEVVFTGSATEANNLALRGAVARWQELNPSAVPKIVVSAIEHESVLETCEALKKTGAEIVIVPVDDKGIIDTKKLKSAIDNRTAVVSVMYANNEIGTIQPVSEIAGIISNFRKQMANNRKNTISHKPLAISHWPLFHTDAVQAFNYLPCRTTELGADSITLSGQKIYGPKGVGILYIRGLAGNNKKIIPIITGGGQEMGVRSGTENVPAIVGFSKAAELVSESREFETKRLRKLQEYFLMRMEKIIPTARMNGDRKNRLPNNINLYFPLNSVGRNKSSQDLIIKLDLAGFAVSPGAACSARVCQPSHVLKAVGFSDERASNSLRITFGRQTRKQDIDKLLAAFKNIIKH